MKRTKAKPTRKPKFPCEWCGYTKRDQEIHGDHRICEAAQARTKAKRIEAWAAVFADTGSQCERDSVFFEKESAAYVAKLYDARPTRAAHLVEADPLARLKEDVLRAARKVWRTAGLNTDPKWLRAVHDLEGAVERLERRTPTERK